MVDRSDWLTLARSFDAGTALQEIERLAGPGMAGRQAGSPGGKVAADYLAGRFAELGLLPAGEAGTFLQPFTIPYVDLVGMPSLTLSAADGTTYEARYGHDFAPIASPYTGAGTGDGAVIWVNHGAHTDYDGLGDPSGAVALCRMPLDQDAYRQAAEHRVSALLVLREDGGLQTRRLARDTSWISATIPAAYVGPQVAEFLLAGSALRVSDLSIQYTPLRLDSRARLSVDMREGEHAPAQNVLGLLPGRDPQHRTEIVVIGAHYDHLGQEPGPVLYPGANDDASGVAALLEIARNWQQAGYTPERSVLFAAWDGEEQGFIGSTYYVQHATLPLGQTVAMLQLDMIGAAGEPTLLLDGAGLVMDEALISAATLGIQAKSASVGRSDHVPFRNASVPATMFIWSGLDATVHYHQPGDTPGNIRPADLQKAGNVAALTALQLASATPQIQTLVQKQQAALAGGNSNAYLATVATPFVPQERERLAGWFSRPSQGVSLTLQSLVVASELATATLRLRLTLANDPAAREISYPASFVRETEGWRYAGLAGEKRRFQQVAVNSAVPGTNTAQLAGRTFGELRRVLGSTLTTTFDLDIWPAGTDLAMLYADSKAALYPAFLRPGGAALAGTDAITNTLVDLALSEIGLPPGKSPWLSSGIAQALQRSTPTQLPEKAGTPPSQVRLLAENAARLWPLASLPAPGGLRAAELALWQAQATSLVDYVLRQEGWRGIAALARASATAPDVEAACRQALGYPLAELESGWRTAEVQPWLDAQAGIDATLRERAQAVQAGDEPTYVATVDENVPTLREEARLWLADVSLHPLAAMTETATLVGLAGSNAEVLFRRETQTAGSPPVSVTQRARFERQGGRWVYAGQGLDTRRGTHVALVFDPAAGNLKETDRSDPLAELLSAAERAWAVVHDDWPSLADGIQVRLYADSGALAASVYPSLPTATTSWSSPGAAVKLALTNNADAGYALAAEFAGLALGQMGVQDRWLLTGAEQVAQQQYDPSRFGADLLHRRRQLCDALRDGQEFDLSQGTIAPTDETGLNLFRVQAWDVVSYLRQNIEPGAWQQACALRGSGRGLQEAFASVTGRDLGNWLAAWRASARVQHFSPEIIALAQRFDPQAALHAVERLAAPEFSGRASGTAGGDMAAGYIVERFGELGLQPAGDAGFLQTFTLPTVELTGTPSLVFRQAGGQPIRDLEYGIEFREYVRGHAGPGEVEAEVVWIGQEKYEGVQLAGRIVMQRLRGDRSAAVEMAQAAGAGGVILVNDGTVDYQLRSLYLPSLAERTIPVVEIPNDLFVQVVKGSGHAMSELATSQPVLRLGFLARLSVPARINRAATAANVLGVIPGTDERLKEQVVIVSAHYDHVGALPNGTYYPGANDDASGVGVLLEAARILQQSGKAPRRTLLFAAWGAEEAGLVGSAYYVGHPRLPLAATTAMIQLDMVGQGRGYYLDLQGDAQKAGELLAALLLGAEQADVRASLAGPSGASDNVPFERAGIPAVVLAWSKGTDAHLPSDTPGAIDAAKLSVAGKTLLAAIQRLAY